MIDYPSPEDYSLGGAAFGLENDVVAAIQYMGRRDYTPDPNFNFDEAYRASPFAQRQPDNFTRAQSLDEFRAIEMRVAEEEAMQQRLAQGGLAGIGLSMVAGLLSPTILLPVGEFKAGQSILRTARNTASWTVAGVAGQEAVLQLNQETRTGEQTAMALGFSAVLGGLIGGGAAYMTAPAAARLEAHMVGGIDPVAIRPLDDSLSAARAPEEFADPGNLAPGFLNRFAPISPTARVFEQDMSPNARAVQAQLTTGGLRTENVSAIGGDLESITKQYEGRAHIVTQGMDKIWKGQARSLAEKFGVGRTEWNREVGRALERGGKSDVPGAAEGAAFIRENIFMPIYRDAKALGLEGFDNISEEEAMSYVTRILRSEVASAKHGDLELILRENAAEQLQKKYLDDLAKIDEADIKTQQAAGDLTMTETQADTQTAILKQQAEELPQQFPEAAPYLSNVEELLSAAKLAEDAAVKKALRAEAKLLQKEAGVILKPYRAALSAIRSRMANLNKTAARLEEKQQAIYRQLDDIEEMQLSSLMSVINQGKAFLQKLGRMSDEAFDAELAKLETKFERVYGTYEKGETKLAKLEAESDAKGLDQSSYRSEEAISKQTQLQAERLARAEAGLEKLQVAQNLDREAVRQAVQDNLDDMLMRVNDTNNKRALRAEALKKRVADIDPAAGIAKAERLKLKQAERMGSFTTKLAERGVKFVNGVPDVTREASDISKHLVETLTKENRRLPALTLMGERGPELRRMLNIDATRVWSNGMKYEDFLERDVHTIMKTYLRTMGPDLELKRRFGTVNPLADNSSIMMKIGEDFRQQYELAGRLPKAQQEKAFVRIAKVKAQTIADLSTQIERLRHVRGIATDPASLSYRAARAAMNWNTVRMMGAVLPASIGDLARPVMKFGLLDTFGDGFGTMVRGLAAMKMVAHEAQLAGVATDMTQSTRLAAMMDVMDDFQHGSAPERALQWGANNIGRFALFNRWNVGVKTFSAAIAIQRIVRSVERMGAGKATKADLNFLTAANLDSESAQLIFRQMQEPGALQDIGGGKMLPNTEDWANVDARRAFRAAIARLVDDTITTPGLERSSWVDMNTGAKMLAQFRSFTLSSTMKTMMAAGQDVRDRPLDIVAGSMLSLAFGALSYYTWATARGGDQEAEMRQADLGKWADEAISRSGLLGILADVHRFGSQTPGLGKFTTFSGGPLSASPFNNTLADTVLGPTGGLLKDLGTIAMTASDPNGQTVGAVRRLVPYNNIFYLSQQFTKIANAAKEAVQ